MKKIVAAGRCIVSALLFVISAANANAGLDGETLGLESLFPDIHTVFSAFPLSAVVGGGVEFPTGPLTQILGYGANAFVDASDLQIIYGQTLWIGGYTAASFNGLHFFDINSAIDDIIGVSVVGGGQTTLDGFDQSRVSFDANNIWINLQDLFDLSAHQVVLALRFADSTSVPEPATLALLGIGLAGLAFSRRKRAN